MESRTGIPNKGLTHAGVFHADDVFATALLRMLNPSIEVVRQNAVPEGFAGIVYDVGGGEFDHHRGEARVRDNGVPFSSFGLLWNRFGTMLLQEEDAESLDKDLVQPIDLADNTGEGNPLSLCVSDFKTRCTWRRFPSLTSRFGRRWIGRRMCWSVASRR